MTWLFNGSPFTSADIGEFYGFIYLITNLVNGKKYIGRKYFYSKRKPAKTKKNEGKRRKRVTSYSDWEDYWGSCDELKDDIKRLGEDKFKREISSLHGATKGSVNYQETKSLFLNNVLESDEFYNSNILGRYFKSIILNSKNLYKEK